MSIHRFLTTFILLTFIQLGLSASQLNLEVSAHSAILMNAQTGAILFEKNSRQVLPPASITKVATAWYALKTNGERLDEIISARQEAIASVKEEAIRRSNYTLPPWWVEMGSSHIGIKRGEELSLRDLLYGMMLRSGNDAANVIAQYVGGSIPNFMEELNEELKRLGFQDTHFKNPHGLHHPKHVTTAYEMAQLTRMALQDPVFREIVRTVRYTRPQTNKNASTIMVQTNQLLKSGKHYYPKAIGVKTGYHSIAQNNLIAAAEYNGRVLIAVLMKCKERSDTFVDARRLFEAAFNQPKVERTLIQKGAQKYVLNLEGAAKPVKSRTEEEVKIQFYPAEQPVIKCRLCWDEDVITPIKKGRRIGELRLVDNNEKVLKRIPLYADEDVKSGWILWMKQLFG